MVLGDYRNTDPTLQNSPRRIAPIPFVGLSIVLSASCTALGMAWAARLLVGVAAGYLMAAGLRLTRDEARAS